MATVNWMAVAEKAKRMTLAQLEYARRDCLAAAAQGMPNPNGPCKGADYYMDEASVYFLELKRRQR